MPLGCNHHVRHNLCVCFQCVSSSSILPKALSGQTKYQLPWCMVVLHVGLCMGMMPRSEVARTVECSRRGID